MKNSLIMNPHIEILVGGKPCFARVDSGADVTVIREDEVPTEILRESSGTTELTDAFGQGVTARLVWVPLGLLVSPRSVAELVKLRCAVTDQLASSVSVLLTPKDYECLRHQRQKRLNCLKERDARENCVKRRFGLGLGQ